MLLQITNINDFNHGWEKTISLRPFTESHYSIEMKFRLIFYQESLSKNGMNQPVIQRLKKLSSACYMQHIISILEPDKVFILLWPLFGTTLSRKSNRNWMNIDLIYSTGRFREIIITWVMWYLTYRMHHYLCHILEVSEIGAEWADFTFW